MVSPSPLTTGFSRALIPVMLVLAIALAVIALLMGALELCAQIAGPTPTPTDWWLDALPTFTVTP